MGWPLVCRRGTRGGGRAELEARADDDMGKAQEAHNPKCRAGVRFAR